MIQLNGHSFIQEESQLILEGSIFIDFLSKSDSVSVSVPEGLRGLPHELGRQTRISSKRASFSACTINEKTFSVIGNVYNQASSASLILNWLLIRQKQGPLLAISSGQAAPAMISGFSVERSSASPKGLFSLQLVYADWDDWSPYFLNGQALLDTSRWLDAKISALLTGSGQETQVLSEQKV